MGLGYWTRANPEICIIATKGVIKRINRGVRNLQICKLREHSRKPDEIRDRIVELSLPGQYGRFFQPHVIAHPAALFLTKNYLTKKAFQVIIIPIDNPYLFSLYPDLHCLHTPLVFHKGMNIRIIPEAKDLSEISSQLGKGMNSTGSAADVQ